MYAVIRSFPQMQNVEEAGRLAETGLAPILKQQPASGPTTSFNLRAAEVARSASSTAPRTPRRRTTARSAWIKENLASMIGGATPVVTMGEVLAEVSAEAVA